MSFHNRAIDCYVLGCSEPPYISTGFKRTPGRIFTFCQGHDPDRHGLGIPLFSGPAPAAVEQPEQQDAAEQQQAQQSELELYRAMFRQFLKLGADDQDDSQGGSRVARPVPPTRPVPPSNARRPDPVEF